MQRLFWLVIVGSTFACHAASAPAVPAPQAPAAPCPTAEPAVAQAPAPAPEPAKPSVTLTCPDHECKVTATSAQMVEADGSVTLLVAIEPPAGTNISCSGPVRGGYMFCGGKADATRCEADGEPKHACSVVGDETLPGSPADEVPRVTFIRRVRAPLPPTASFGIRLGLCTENGKGPCTVEKATVNAAITPH